MSGYRRTMTQGWLRVVLAAVSALVRSSCSNPFGEPDLRPREVSAEQAQEALSQELIELPSGFVFVAGRMTSVGFAGSPGYDLIYDAPAALFDDPKQLESAYTGSGYARAFSTFRDIDCNAGLLVVARDRGWVRCTPETRAEFSTTGADPTDSTHGLYRNSIVLVGADSKTQVIVVIGGS